MARPRTRGRSKARGLRRQWLRLAVRRQPPSQCQWQWWCRWRRLRWMLQAQPSVRPSARGDRSVQEVRGCLSV